MASQAPTTASSDTVPTEPVDPFTARLRTIGRLARRLGLVAVAVVVLGALVSVAVRLETNRLWFRSVHASGVYGTQLRAQVLLFVVGAVVAGALGALAVVLVQRRPVPTAPWHHSEDEETRGWRAWVEARPVLANRLVLAVFTLVPAYRVGTAAAGRWQAYLLWRHAAPWGVTDAVHHRDVSYYVEVYPFHRAVANLLGSALTWALVATVVAGLVHASLRLRGPARRFTRPLVGQLSALAAGYLLVRAAGWWLDRAALVTSNRGPVTGLSYTDAHATSPGRLALVVLGVLLALALAANAVLRRRRVLVGTLAAAVVATLLLGSAWPALVQRFREVPSAATVDLPQIRRNQAATAAAFGLEHVRTVDAAPAAGSGAAGSGSAAALTRAALQDTRLRALDPNRLSPTFTVKQQIQAFYGFKNTLDVDRYPVDGTPTDLALGVRELHVGDVPRSTWANRHLVYTHGYGVVAAPTSSMDSRGVPRFVDGGAPDGSTLGVTEPRIYFGQSSPSYSIVGAPQGTDPVEFDHPAFGTTDGAHTTYDGGGGVPVGSTWNRLLYAIRMGSPQILLSSALNADSQILYDRDPRSRVAAVAPWLRLDGDAYPAVVDGHVDWVVDGYTSSATYPEAQQVDLRQATTSTLTAQGASTAERGTVNYLRDSVKATVDAYTGQVTLYEWNQDAQPDPLLKAWESVFPGVVQPQSAMPAGLVDHLRYPQDLFDVQRQLLTRYHVGDAADFYNGNDFWSVPTDPTVAAAQQLNSSSLYTPPSHTPSDPSVYQTMSADGTSPARYALASPLVSLDRHNLTALLSVDAAPGPGYGDLTLLHFPAAASIGAPSQVQNDIESSTRISEALTLQRGGNSTVVLGQLVPVPLGDRVLYVEPVYTQAQGGSSFPILRHVIAVYGDGDPAFADDLPTAVRQAIASGVRAAG